MRRLGGVGGGEMAETSEIANQSRLLGIVEKTSSSTETLIRALQQFFMKKS